MEGYEKLKLLRGLYCLSQEEMATLAKGCQRSIYSAAEMKKKPRQLTVGQAEALQETLGFEAGWFAGTFTHPMQGCRFIFIDLDWSRRHLAVTENVRKRRINDAERSVEAYLPKMLAENRPVQCWTGKTRGKNRLAFFLFQEQALLLRTIPKQPITEKIIKIIRSLDKPPKPVMLSDAEFDKISSYSANAMLPFLEKCDIAEETLQLFRPAIAALPGKHFDYSKIFGDTVREATLNRICQDMLLYGITPDDVTEAFNRLTMTAQDCEHKNSARQ